MAAVLSVLPGASFAISAAQAAADLAFSASPIILTAGIATLLGGYLPIGVFTGAVGVLGTLTSSGTVSTSSFAAQFKVQPGGTALRYEYGQFPFANQNTAANAVITQPNRISVLMSVPANDATGGVAGRAALLATIQAAINLHVLSGGMFTVLTPGLTYSNLLLEQIADASAGDDLQVQYDWRWDFWQPLVTQAQATAAAGLLGSITNGLPPTGSIAAPTSLTSIYGAPSAVSVPAPAPLGGP